MTHIGKRIRDRRIELGLSQIDLSRQAGMTPSALCHLESGKNKSTFRLIELAKALGVDPQWLQSGREPERSAPRRRADGECRKCDGKDFVQLNRKLRRLPPEAIVAICRLADVYAATHAPGIAACIPD